MQVIFSTLDILFINLPTIDIDSRINLEEKMNFRTDLALERREYIAKKELDGIKSFETMKNSMKITTIEVLNEDGEKLLSKPKGKYITVEVGSFLKRDETDEKAIETLAQIIRELLPKKENGSVLVAGLGNEKITPDALGPKCVSLILATRHISDEFANSIGLENLRSVSGISPGVLGKTGIETSEIIEAVVKKTKPCAVIAVDALASRKLARLGTTVQLSDSGISPGSGVGNARKAINRQTLGIPVVAIGIPTVVDAATMVLDVFEKYNKKEAFQGDISNGDESLMMVTPKEIDLVVERAALFVALSINKALQENMEISDILKIVK